MLVIVVVGRGLDVEAATACTSFGVPGECVPNAYCGASLTADDNANCTGSGILCCPNVQITPVPTSIPGPTPIDCTDRIIVPNPLLIPSCALKEIPTMGIFVVNMGIITGAVAGLIMLLYGGMLIIMAGDDTAKAENGRKAVMWSVLGLIVAASLFTVMQFVTTLLNVPGFGYVGTAYAAQEDAVQTYQVFGTIRGVGDDILPGAKVVLYQQVDGQWFVWDGQSQGNQRNPYEVDVFGHYQFFAPEGTYYTVASKFGYHSAQSDSFVVNGAPIKQNLTLETASSIWVYILYFGIMLFVGSVSYFTIVGVVRWRKRVELKRYAQGKLRENTSRTKSTQDPLQ